MASPRAQLGLLLLLLLQQLFPVSSVCLTSWGSDVKRFILSNSDLVDAVTAYKEVTAGGQGCGDLSAWGAIADWDVKAVTVMTEVFKDIPYFDGDLKNWNVAAVTSFKSTFQNARRFDRDLSLWNVGMGTNFESMFQGAHNFNSNIVSWNVAKATNMASMFKDAQTFNSPLHNWNVGLVTNMNSMFQGAMSFHGHDMNSWDVDHVTNMGSMFEGATNFMGYFPSWDTSAVTVMSSMFKGATRFGSEVRKWNVAHVTDFTSMFEDCPHFNDPLAAWTMTQATNLSSMFKGGKRFNQNVGAWNVAAVTSFKSMFEGAHSFNQDVGTWVPTAGVNFNSMFRDAFAFCPKTGMAAWTFAQATDVKYMLYNANLATANSCYANYQALGFSGFVATDKVAQLATVIIKGPDVDIETFPVLFSYFYETQSTRYVFYHSVVACSAIAVTSSADITGAVVTISENFLLGDMLYPASSETIFGVYVAATGVLTMTGTTTTAAYQTYLRGIKFLPSRTYEFTDTPSEHIKTLTFKVTNANGTTEAKRSIHVTTTIRVYDESIPQTINSFQS